MNKFMDMRLNADDLILQALKEDITSEDITTNAVMRTSVKGKAELICKDQGVIAGCAGGLYDSIYEAASILKGHTGGCGDYGPGAGPASCACCAAGPGTAAGPRRDEP